jgi:thiamine-monophosphate kinase
LSGARVERRFAAIPAAYDAGCSRLTCEDDTGTLARVAGVSDGLVVDLGHICEGSGVSAVIEVTALPLSPSRIIAEDLDLVPRLSGGSDDCELVFTSPSDASLAIECLPPELALPITATGTIERKAGVRLVDRRQHCRTDRRNRR